jgi:hypothetical protein
LHFGEPRRRAKRLGSAVLPLYPLDKLQYLLFPFCPKNQSALYQIQKAGDKNRLFVAFAAKLNRI